jgi:hypothetical protein
MARRQSAYKLREQSISYDRFFNKWKVGSRYEFEFPQLADVFVYCWKQYGPSVAEEVAKDLKEKLDMTIAKFVGKAATAEAVDTVKDALLGLGGAPQAPTPVAMALKILDCMGTVLGEWTIKQQIEMNKNWKNYSCTISPTYDVDKYCNWVLYSWIIDPVNGPYYRVG